MRIDRPWFLVWALAVAAQIFALGALPFEIAEPWDKAWHFLAYAALTLFLWIATDGRRYPALVIGVIGLAAFDELRQGWIPARSADVTDFITCFCAAVGTAVALSITTQGNKATCAESSRRSPAGTSSRS